jgi:OCT family organic cation transporter-like MFS transporter 4/5
MDRLNNFRRQGYDKVKNEDEGESLLERDTPQPGNLHPKMDYDSILAEIGEFGRWQQMIQALLWIPAIFCGVNGLMFSFTGLQPTNGFRCKIPDCDGDDFNFTDFSANIFPSESDGDPDYCKFYRPLPTDPSFPGNCSHEGFSDEVMECGSNVEYTYNAFQFEETLVTKWNLVCGQEFKVSLVISMYMFGLMSGSLLCGRMADKFGRKKTLVFCVLWASTTSLLGCFMPGYYSYTATRYGGSKEK